MIRLSRFEQILLIDDLVSISRVGWEVVLLEMALDLVTLVVIIIKVLFFLSLDLSWVSHCAQFAEIIQ